MKIKDWLARGAISCVLAFAFSNTQAALNANNADIKLDANIPTMQLAINPGGKGCTTVQEWDTSTGGCRNLSDTAKVISVAASSSTMGATNGSVSLVAVVTSKSGKRVPYAQVTWSTNNGTLAYATSTTNAQGEATNVLSNARLGSSTVTASAVNGAASVSVSVTQTSVVASLVATPPSVLANGTAYSTLVATLRDANGNAAGAGEPVTWSTNLGSLSTASSTSNAASQATATISSLNVGTATVTARAYSGASTTVAFTTPAVAPVISKFSVKGDNSGWVYYSRRDVNGNQMSDNNHPFFATLGTPDRFSWTVSGADRYEIKDQSGTVVYTGSASATYWDTAGYVGKVMSSPGMTSQSKSFYVLNGYKGSAKTNTTFTLVAYSGTASTSSTINVTASCIDNDGSNQ